MWMMVLFDLPVGTPKERKAASRFRHRLLDLGFGMSQYSVYLRYCAGREEVETYTRRIQEFVPKVGKVHILTFTDKQYENIVSFRGQRREDPWKNPDQFVLF